MQRIIRIAIITLFFALPVSAQSKYSALGEWEATTTNESFGFTTVVVDRLTLNEGNNFSTKGDCLATYGKGKNSFKFIYTVNGKYSFGEGNIYFDYDIESFNVDYKDDDVPAIIPRPLLNTIFESFRKRLSKPETYIFTQNGEKEMSLKNTKEKNAENIKYIKIK